MKRTIALICALVALSIVVVGCGDDDDSGGNGASEQTTETTEGTQGSGGGGGEPAKQVTVDMKDTEYVPQDVTVARGGTVTWTNSDPYAHTVTKEAGPGIQFDSGDITGGSTFEQKFDAVGTINYVCTIHPNQTGTITVE